MSPLCSKQFRLVSVLLSASAILSAGEKPTRLDIPFPNPRLTMAGLPWFAENGGRLARLPARLKDTFRPVVWSLAQHTSGVRIRFRTNATSVRVQAKGSTGQAPHMTSVMRNGLDFYVDGRYKGSAWPGAKGVLSRSFSTYGPASKFRDITIHLPLYNSIKIERISLSPGAEVRPPSAFSLDKPIVYYGSSITQGGCASNPGLSYQAILGRRLNLDFVNLGFSGNGVGEAEVADAVAEIEAAAFVLDYWANPNPETYKRTLPPFVRILRAKHPNVPIVITSPFFNPGRERIQADKRKTTREFVAAQRAAGDTNVHYVEGLEMISEDTAWGLVDARHANSLGFYLCANGLEPHLRRILNLPKQ
ncbi:MAG: hypothetical protein KAI66_13375 [Lentisphaeria bacterium]|nr:hypothetical protein [Lentisphaeria bacterium]